MKYGVGLLLILAALAGCADHSPPPLTPRAVLGAGAMGSGFAAVVAPRAFSFPRDHAAHPDFRTEWWYATGHLVGGGREFGYQLSLFRFGLEPGAPPAGRGWSAGHLYLGHFALTDLAERRFHAAERFSRGSAGLAGVRGDPWPEVWVEDFSMSFGDQGLRVRAADGGYALDLSLRAVRPPVLNGEAGLSRKGQAPGQASYYYSMPQLKADGSVRVPGGGEIAVSGDGWLDREWSSEGLAPEQAGWDWFAIRFDDQATLMLYRLRDRRGESHAYSGGTYVAPEGAVRALEAGEVEYRVRRHWTSPATGARYPLAWRIGIPALDLEVEVDPLLDAQELDLSFRYWEGAARVRGTLAGRAREGRAYVELTGYDSD